MKATIKQWGNSAAIRIPASVLAAARLSLDEPVDVREEAGRIIIEPVRTKSYDVNALVDGITTRNQHQAVDVGGPEGREHW